MLGPYRKKAHTNEIIEKRDPQEVAWTEEEIVALNLYCSRGMTTATAADFLSRRFQKRGKNKIKDKLKDLGLDAYDPDRKEWDLTRTDAYIESRNPYQDLEHFVAMVEFMQREMKNLEVS